MDYIPLPESEFMKKNKTQSWKEGCKEFGYSFTLLILALILALLVYVGFGHIVTLYAHDLNSVSL